MRVPLALVLSLLATASHAQDAPPIKTGLWHVTNVREVDGKRQPDVGARMKEMNPDLRKRLDDNLRAHGIDMSAGDGSMKMCMTRESFDKGRWQGAAEGCKTDFKTRTASKWTWHSTCTMPPSESDGEASFASSESYTVKSSSTVKIQGKTQQVSMALTGKWLGADCGDLKPVTPPARPASRPNVPNAKP